MSVWKTGFDIHAVCVEEADVGEVVRVGPVRQAQQQLPLHASKTVDLLLKVFINDGGSRVVLKYVVIEQISLIKLFEIVNNISPNTNLIEPVFSGLPPAVKDCHRHRHHGLLSEDQVA